MEGMIKSMLKSFGFDPETVKAQINNASEEYKQLKIQIDRMEQKINELLAR